MYHSYLIEIILTTSVISQINGYLYFETTAVSKFEHADRITLSCSMEFTIWMDILILCLHTLALCVS